MSGQIPNPKLLGSPDSAAHRSQLLAVILDSFGDAIAAEAGAILNEPGGEKLPLLTLVAMAEERHFQLQVGGLTALSAQRTDSQFQIVEVEDEDDDEDS